MSLLRGETPKLPWEEEGMSLLCVETIGEGHTGQWVEISQCEDSGIVGGIGHQGPMST